MNYLYGPIYGLKNRLTDTHYKGLVIINELKKHLLGFQHVLLVTLTIFITASLKIF